MIMLATYTAVQNLLWMGGFWAKQLQGRQTGWLIFTLDGSNDVNSF